MTRDPIEEAINLKDFDDAWEDGFAAGLTDEARETNPFPYTHPLHHDWNDGWLEGRR